MRTKKGLVAGVVAGAVAVGAVVGALMFAPGLGIAQTDDATRGTVGDRIGWCFGDGHGPLAVAAEAIGIPRGDLLYAMRGGSTIAEVASSEGVEVRVVIDALVASMQERLDVAVREGFFSQDVADEIAAGFEERATSLVNDAFPGFPGFHRGPGFGRGPWGEESPEAWAEPFPA